MCLWGEGDQQNQLCVWVSDKEINDSKKEQVAVSLDVKKAYDTVWKDGFFLWVRRGESCWLNMQDSSQNRKCLVTVLWGWKWLTEKHCQPCFVFDKDCQDWEFYLDSWKWPGEQNYVKISLPQLGLYLLFPCGYSPECLWISESWIVWKNEKWTGWGQVAWLLFISCPLLPYCSSHSKPISRFSADVLTC